MGRKLDTEKPKRGPGRKAKRQQDPVLPKSLNDVTTESNKKLSSHQRKRKKAALQKEAEMQREKAARAEKKALARNNKSQTIKKSATKDRVIKQKNHSSSLDKPSGIKGSRRPHRKGKKFNK